MEVLGEKQPCRRTYPRSPGDMNLLKSKTNFSTASMSSGNSVSRGLDFKYGPIPGPNLTNGHLFTILLTISLMRMIVPNGDRRPSLYQKPRT